MKRAIRLHHLVAAAAVAATAAAAAPGVVEATRPGPDVPSTIAVPPGNKVFLVGHAVGAQIYSCGDSATGPRWALVAPRADLYNDHGKRIATHFGGPTWEARDGGTVVGRRVDGVTVDPTAIPWLLLEAASTTAGPQGDRLTSASFIQRTRTVGGLEPAATDCNAGTLGTTVEVPYTANYRFWKPAGC